MCSFPPNNDSAKVSLLYIVMNSYKKLGSQIAIRKNLLFAFNFCFRVWGILYRCKESYMFAVNIYLLKKNSPIKLNACLNSNTNDI